jgi:hypothetical protein
VGVPGGEVADVERDAGEALRLHDQTGRQEALGDPALVEHLDRARVETARPATVDVRARPPLDDHHVRTDEGQLSCQHHPGRPAAGDDHGVLVRPTHPTLPLLVGPWPAPAKGHVQHDSCVCGKPHAARYPEGGEDLLGRSTRTGSVLGTPVRPAT